MTAPDPPEDEAGFDEELDMEPSTSTGRRPPQRMTSHAIKEAVRVGGDDDDDR
jgi:hypothetical protein